MGWISAVASIGSALLSSSSSNQASDASSAAAQTGVLESRRRFDLARLDTQLQRQTGNNALVALNQYLLGINPAQTTTSTSNPRIQGLDNQIASLEGRIRRGRTSGERVFGTGNNWERALAPDPLGAIRPFDDGQREVELQELINERDLLIAQDQQSGGYSANTMGPPTGTRETRGVARNLAKPLDIRGSGGEGVDYGYNVFDAYQNSDTESFEVDPLSFSFDASEYSIDPNDIDITLDEGYQFRLDEGNRALENALSAQGRNMGGSKIREAIRYNQGFASNEYGRAFDRTMRARDANFAKDFSASNEAYNRYFNANEQNYTRAFNTNQVAYQRGAQERDRAFSRQDAALSRLFTLAGFGTAGANTSASAGASASSNISGLLQSNARNQANIAMNQGQTYSDIFNNYMQNYDTNRRVQDFYNTGGPMNRGGGPYDWAGPDYRNMS